MAASKYKPAAEKSMEVSAPQRIVLLGKTGVGKSSLANILVGNDAFVINYAGNSETSNCQAETVSVNGRSVTVVDTPGFFDTSGPDEELKKVILSCITECSPGPHAFLILLKVERYTEHEKAVVRKIRECFSEEAFRFAAVVFTHGDQLPEGMKIEEFVDKSDGLKDLVKKCGGRCHVIDSKYWKTPQDEYRNNKVQVAELHKTIEKIMMENEGGFYTNEMLQKVEKEIAEEEKRIRKSSVNLSQDEIRERAKKAAQKKIVIIFGATTAGALLGAFLGVTVAMNLLAPVVSRALLSTAVATVGGGEVGAAIVRGAAVGAKAVGAKMAEVVGGAVLQTIGYVAAEEADATLDAARDEAKDGDKKRDGSQRPSQQKEHQL